MKTVMFLVLMLVIGHGMAYAQVRSWTDDTGKYKVRAELVDFTDGIVQLKRVDGNIVSLSLERLSEADRAFVLGQISYRYQNRKVSAVWFDKMYKRFADKIIRDGEGYQNIGKELIGKPGIWKKPPRVGALRWGKAESFWRRATVLQVLEDKECLLTIGLRGIGIPERTITVHVSDAPQLIDDADFPDVPLIYVGPHSYVTTIGARSTIQGYRVYHPTPLTRAEFAKALENGLQLVEYRQIKNRVPVRGIQGGGFHVRSVTRMEEREEIVATPIP